MMMDSVGALPHARLRLGAVRRHPAGLHARARAGGAAPGRLGQDVRPAARADLRRAGARAVPPDEHRRRALRLLPAERRLPRSVAADDRAGRRRARGRLPRVHAHARDGHRRRSRPRCAACRPSGARSRPRWSVNAGGMFAAELGRMAGVRVPIVPFAHEYLVTQPFRERTPGEHLPTLRDPDLLIYFREEGGGLVMGGYERGVGAVGAGRAPARTRFRPTSTAACWRRTGRASRRSRRTPPERVPAMDEITVTRLINGPEAFTPDNEFCLGETEVGGLFVAAGFCAHGLAGRRRDRARDGRVDPRGRAGDRRVGDGHPPLRPALPLARLHAQARQGGL